MQLRLPSLLLVLLSGVILGLHGADTPAPALAETKQLAAAALERTDLVDYRGWIKYLLFDAEATVAREGAASERAVAKVNRLDEWVRRIAADPRTLAQLRGVQEWAYESPADDSGQPFKVMIPTDYDPAHPTPVSLYMHGYSGDHLKHSTGMAAHTGFFEVSVLGRSRGGGYIGLSEADVLHVVDYLQTHWNIDPARIHIMGGSMGGGGTFKLGARYPHRFASGQITCGYLWQEPINNLLTFPIYATHSDDDPTVPINLARGPLHELRRAGGQAIFDETTGFGHAVWDYKSGNERATAWAALQVSPASREVRHIDFTAVDGKARRGWWGEVVEWGPEPKPAHFVLTAGANNTLFAELNNIDRLRVRLAESPFDRTKPLHLVVAGAVPVDLPAPLPEETIIVSRSARDQSPTAASDFRLHTPGGPLSLYDGSPLLIVYGTRGDAVANQAMRTAAEAAARSSNPAWLGEEIGEIDPADADRTRHIHLLFGHLKLKADTEVTSADLERCHLVLIGTAAENAVVASIADRLPVRLSGDKLVWSDGLTLPAAHRTVGLVHFNPAAPQRLLFWVAATESAAYAPGVTVATLGARMWIGADCLVTNTAGALIATRSFDSRWHWVSGRAESPALPVSLAASGALSRAMAASVRRATAADFAVAFPLVALEEGALTAGVTRVADVAPLLYDQPVDLLEMTGAEILTAGQKLAAASGPEEQHMAFEPALASAQIDPAKHYSVAMPVAGYFQFGTTTLINPRLQRRTDVMVDDAITRFLIRP